jgi:hypothetical protein
MAMKRTHDAVYAGEKYTDRDGNEKTRYVNIGSLFTRDDGSLTAKLDAVPVGFNGWVNFYVPKDKEGEKSARPARGRSEPNDDLPPF